MKLSAIFQSGSKIGLTLAALAIVPNARALNREPTECTDQITYKQTAEEQRTRSENAALPEAERKSYLAEAIRYDSLATKAGIACTRARTKRDSEITECKNKGALYKWNPRTEECEDKTETKSNPNSGECANAELARGDLKGENCKNTAQTIKDVGTRTEAIGQSALATTQAFSTMQAMQTTGQQADVQDRQQKIMTGLAAMKILTGAVSLTSAASLKSAPADAETASNNISAAAKAIRQECSQSENDKYTDEQCFYIKAHQHGIDPSNVTYANYQRLNLGADESQAQANRANEMAKASMVTGAADTIVGLQALYMARQAGQNVAALAPPPMPMAQTNLMAPMTGAVNGNGLGSISSPGDVTPGTVDGVPLGGPTNANIKGSIVGNRPVAFNTYKPERSGVSGGGGGLGGGGGGSGRSAAPPRRRGAPRNTKSGEFSLGGGTGVAGGGKGGDKDAGAAGNPLADILGKLFPQNQEGKPVVDGRSLASTGPGAEETEQTSEAAPSELSLFEQVNTRYRTLNASGRI